jgi:hypothetical protein
MCVPEIVNTNVEVEWHLSKVFAKLGITSRAGLYDALPTRRRSAVPTLASD